MLPAVRGKDTRSLFRHPWAQAGPNECFHTGRRQRFRGMWRGGQSGDGGYAFGWISGEGPAGGGCGLLLWEWFSTGRVVACPDVGCATVYPRVRRDEHDHTAIGAPDVGACPGGGCGCGRHDDGRAGGGLGRRFGRCCPHRAAGSTGTADFPVRGRVRRLVPCRGTQLHAQPAGPHRDVVHHSEHRLARSDLGVRERLRRQSAVRPGIRLRGDQLSHRLAAAGGISTRSGKRDRMGRYPAAQAPVRTPRRPVRTRCAPPMCSAHHHRTVPHRAHRGAVRAAARTWTRLPPAPLSAAWPTAAARMTDGGLSVFAQLAIRTAGFER